MAVSSAVPIIVMSLFFLGIALGGFFFVGKNSSDRGLLRMMIITTCLCLWVFWLSTFMSQINPLVGPEIKVEEACLRDDAGQWHC